jgi:hypothetical protein
VGLVPIEPSDALAIFEKWNSEDIPVLCQGSFFGCALRLVGKVSLLGEMVVELSSGPWAGVRVDLGWKDLTLSYVEPKDTSADVPEYAKSASAIAIGLPRQAELVPFREKLIFVELRRQEDAD